MHLLFQNLRFVFAYETKLFIYSLEFVAINIVFLKCKLSKIIWLHDHLDKLLSLSFSIAEVALKKFKLVDDG